MTEEQAAALLIEGMLLPKFCIIYAALEQSIIEIIKSSRGFQIRYYIVIVRCKNRKAKKGLKVGDLSVKMGV